MTDWEFILDRYGSFGMMLWIKTKTKKYLVKLCTVRNTMMLMEFAIYSKMQLLFGEWGKQKFKAVDLLVVLY